MGLVVVPKTTSLLSRIEGIVLLSVASGYATLAVVAHAFMVQEVMAGEMRSALVEFAVQPICAGIASWYFAMWQERR